MRQGTNSKLEIKLFEQFTPHENVLLGKVVVYTSQFWNYLGASKVFPLDPVERPIRVPDFSIARYLLVLSSSLVIEFQDISYYLPRISPSDDLSETSVNQVNPSPISSPPPLPSRTSTSTNSPSNIETSSLDSAEVGVSNNDNGQAGYQKPLPPLPPKASPPTQRGEDGTQGPALLVSANNTPKPVKPTQTWFGKIADYFSSGSSSLVSDTWYHRILSSDKNELPKFESFYYAYETKGHVEMLASNSRQLSNYSFLYVPGLYSGRKVGQSNSAEGKLTKHQERVQQMCELGIDAELIVVPNDGTVLNNAEIIASKIYETCKAKRKYIILIGYSKGGVDSAAALSLYPDLVPYVRCFITLMSPLYGSHVASDIEDSMLRPVVYLAIKNLLDADTDAVKDLSFERRANFITNHPFDERVPTLSLAAAVTTVSKTSPFLAPYKYILSKYNKENDGLVACHDAVYPNASLVLIPSMDHVGPRPEYPVYRNHISFILAAIDTALDSTEGKWDAFCIDLRQAPDTSPPIQEHPTPKLMSSQSDADQTIVYPPIEDDFFIPPEPVAQETNLINFADDSLLENAGQQAFVHDQVAQPDYSKSPPEREGPSPGQ